MKHLIYRIKFIGVCAFVLFGAISCDQKDFLENENKTNLTDLTQWASDINADIFLNDCYSQIPNLWNEAENLDYYTDDYNISHYYTASNWRIGVCQTPPSSTTNVWGGTHGPTEGYTWVLWSTKVRKVNTFIQKLTENKRQVF